MIPLDLIIDPIKTQGIVAAKLWLGQGSSADPEGQKGAHQLLSSLLSRGCGPFNNIEIAELVEGYGAGLRSESNEDGLLISLKCAEEDALHLLPVLGWMVTNPHLDESQIKLEKDLSLQALQRQRENPFNIAYDGWRSLAYGDGPYGHDPLGITEEVKLLNREKLLDLSNCIKTNQLPILSISGSIDNKLVERILNKDPFKFWGSNVRSNLKDKKYNIKMQRGSINTSNIYLEAEETEQVVLMLGQATLPHGHNDDLPLRILSCYLGTGMSCLLFKLLREENGVAYEVGVHYPPREQAAPFILHASTSEEKAIITLKLLHRIWKNLSEELISEDELKLAKSKFKGLLANFSQTSSQRAERHVQLKAYGLNVDYDVYTLQLISKIKSQDLQRVARKYLQKPLLSLCGPKKTLSKLSKFWLSEN